MAFSDYHICDCCGERKTFYDAEMNAEWVADHWRYDWASGGEGYPPFMGYRAYALCHECEKTHRIAILPAQGMSAGTAETPQVAQGEGRQPGSQSECANNQELNP